MSLSVKIDYREQDLWKQFQTIAWIEPKPCIELANLILGDIQIQDSTTTLIIERKTWSDLCCSIKDGRYREQRSRLSEWKKEKHHHVIYLIEGVSTDPVAKSCLRVLHRLTLFHGFMMYRTQTIQETSQYLEWLIHQFSTFSEFEPQPEKVLQQQYLEDTVSHKKDIKTPKNLLAVLFYGISGISKETAIQLTQPYDSIYSFCEQLRSNPTQMKKELEEQHIGHKRWGSKKVSLLLHMIGYQSFHK